METIKIILQFDRESSSYNKEFILSNFMKLIKERSDEFGRRGKDKTKIYSDLRLACNV